MSTLPTRILKEALDNCKLTVGDLRVFLPKTKDAQEKFEAFSKWKMSPESSPSTFTNQDFRFCHLLLKNFRKFGYLPENAYYGLQLEKTSRNGEKEITDFLTLLGDNGVGKSSLVDSLEYMFTESIGEASIRQIPSELYIRNVSGERTVKVYMANGEQFTLADEKCKAFRKEYDVSNFFFSENSILKFAEYTQRNGDNSNDWFVFFCYMLGIGTLYDACSNNGILDQIKAEVIKTKNEMTSEDVYQLRQNLQNLLRDGSINISEKQRTALTQLQTKLVNTVQDIKDGKIGGTRESLNTFRKIDFHYLTAFYFIQDFQKIYNDITFQPSSDGISLGIPSKKIVLEEKKKETEYTQRFLDAIEECLEHIENILKYGTGIVPLKDIEEGVLKLIHKEQVDLVVEHHKTLDELDILVSQIDILKSILLNLIHKTVVGYVDKSLVDAVKSIFDETFIVKDEEKFVFDISNLDKNNKVTISINEVPVHKYFNTFRYRLFCLTLQAVLNIKLMKDGDFLFPFIMDDIFYANDYRNKRELFKYFEQIIKYAKKTLGKNKNLQIIFFTHDEQIVSCFSTKFHTTENERISFVRLIQPDFAIKFEKNEMHFDEKDEMYHNLYFELYG